MIDKSKNFNKISNSVYWVKNQNGFNNSLYDYFKDYHKKEVRNMVQNYPTKYPTYVVIINQVFECSRIFVEIIEESKFK